MAFRGRGRGRGAPIARHDIQLAEDEQVSDVPYTFPKPTLGQMPPKAKEQPLNAEQQRLLMRFTKIRNAYRSSPYFLESIAAAKSDEVKASAPDVKKYGDASGGGPMQTSRRPLHEVIIMHEKYMPKELFSEKQQKKSLRARKAKPKQQAVKQEMDMDLTQLQKDAEGEKEDGEEDGDDKEEEGAPEEEDDDDEFDHEDDDYYQGEHFDDDEEYADDGDDGNGEAYF